MGLQSLPLHELELLQLVTEAVPKGSRLLGAAGVRLAKCERRHFNLLIHHFKNKDFSVIFSMVFKITSEKNILLMTLKKIMVA